MCERVQREPMERKTLRERDKGVISSKNRFQFPPARHGRATGPDPLRSLPYLCSHPPFAKPALLSQGEVPVKGCMDDERTRCGCPIRSASSVLARAGAYSGENRIGKGLGKEQEVREGGNEKSDSRSALNARTLERDSAWVSGEKTGEDTRACAMCASESGTVQLCNGFLILNAAAAAAARNCR